MTQQVLTALYDRPEDAAAAVGRLQQLGIARDNISVVAAGPDPAQAPADADTTPNWLIPTLTGAGIGVATAGPVGAVVGALVGAGLPVEHAAGGGGNRRGGTLVGVRVEQEQVGPALAILDGSGPVGKAERTVQPAPQTPGGAGAEPLAAGRIGVPSGSASTPDPSTADTLSPADLAGNTPVAGSGIADAGPVVDKDPETAKRDVTPAPPRAPTSTRG